MQFDFREELGKMTPKIAEGAKIYVYGADQRWARICRMFKNLVGADISASIDGFIDDGDGGAGAGSQFCGKPVIGAGSIGTSGIGAGGISAASSVVLLLPCSWRQSKEDARRLCGMGWRFRHSVFGDDCFLTNLMRYEHARMARFKDRHRGERCFVIGNGPSLKAEDLDLLKGEISFAANKIYLVFGHTGWRPTYYCVSDDIVLGEVHSRLNDLVGCDIFYSCNTVFDIEDFGLKNGYYFFTDNRSALWQPPGSPRLEFSETPTVLRGGETVTYISLQLAAYMGFAEIVLLGMDHTYSLTIKGNGELVTDGASDHFSAEYGPSGLYIANIGAMNAAYASAREYAERHGIRILNATRGGRLEVFERASLESVVAKTPKPGKRLFLATAMQTEAGAVPAGRR
jgi:hypothetical protein